MFKTLKNIIWFIFLILAVMNIFVFLKSIKISTDISLLEKEIKRLHQENIELEKEAFNFDSLQYAASVAASLDFNKKSQPLYLDNAKYARK